MNIQAFNALVAERHPELRDGLDWWFEDAGDGVKLARWPDGLAIPSESEVNVKAGELALKAALTENNDAYNSASRAFTAEYPDLEKDTWPTQRDESEAWAADPDNALTPWVNRAANRRELSREEYLRRTLAKAWQFQVISAELSGSRQRYEAQIKAGETPVVDYTLASAIHAELQAKSFLIMTTATAELNDLLINLAAQQ